MVKDLVKVSERIGSSVSGKANVMRKIWEVSTSADEKLATEATSCAVMGAQYISMVIALKSEGEAVGTTGWK